MSELKLSYSGYVCAPYLHTHESVELKESWINSKNIEKLFFVTCTFSSESKPYFSDSINHYLLAKFKDSEQISKDLSKHNQEKTSFVFNIKDDLFQREVQGETNFVSVYYMEYGEDGEDLQEIAHLLLKREKVEKAGLGNMNTCCSIPSKFTFPYSENIIVLEVASEKSHQSVKKYCEKTRRDANRKGLTMTNLMSLSILDHLK
jgi:YesN/AraC family two-component response regulator